MINTTFVCIENIPYLQGMKRRVVHATLYEMIAISVSTAGLAFLSGQTVEHSSVIAVAASIIAIVWNLLFNRMFELWEVRQKVRGRSILRRVSHALGFEGGLVITLVPLMAWWFDMTLRQALVMNLGMIVFFLFYTFVFNWIFDRVFGLPA